MIELYENSIAEHKSVYNNSKFIKTNLLIVNEIFNIIMMVCDNKIRLLLHLYSHKPSKRMTAEELIELYENSIAEHKSV
ncbi:hypothetical protein ACUOFC_59245, partial [Escherichia sp. TWPC-MK]